MNWVQVTQLQGALLVDGPTIADNICKIFRQKNVDARKIFICLLLNTDKFVDSSKLSTKQSKIYAPFSTFGHKINVETFLSIVDKCGLWHLFFEALPFIPLATDCLEIDKFDGDALMLTSFVAALLRQARLHHVDNVVVSSQLDKLFRLTSKEPPCRQLLFTLYLTRLSLSSDANDVFIKSVKTSTEQELKRYFDVNVDADRLRVTDSEVVQKLLSHCVDLAKMISVDIWCDLTEERTDSLLKLPFINFWFIKYLY